MISFSFKNDKILRMKILLVLPSHLKTVPMNHFSAKALSSLGHEVVIESYHANFLDKVLNKIRKYSTPPRNIGTMLITAFKKRLLALNLTYYLPFTALNYQQKHCK